MAGPARETDKPRRPPDGSAPRGAAWPVRSAWWSSAGSAGSAGWGAAWVRSAGWGAAWPSTVRLVWRRRVGRVRLVWRRRVGRVRRVGRRRVGRVRRVGRRRVSTLRRVGRVRLVWRRLASRVRRVELRQVGRVRPPPAARSGAVGARREAASIAMPCARQARDPAAVLPPDGDCQPLLNGERGLSTQHHTA